MERHKHLFGAAVMAASLLFAGSPVFAADGEIKGDLKELKQDHQELRQDRKDRTHYFFRLGEMTDECALAHLAKVPAKEFVNPKVAPGKVTWHKDLAAACAAAAASPVPAATCRPDRRRLGSHAVGDGRGACARWGPPPRRPARAG